MSLRTCACVAVGGAAQKFVLARAVLLFCCIRIPRKLPGTSRFNNTRDDTRLHQNLLPAHTQRARLLDIESTFAVDDTVAASKTIRLTHRDKVPGRPTTSISRGAESVARLPAGSVVTQAPRYNAS